MNPDHKKTHEGEQDEARQKHNDYLTIDKETSEYSDKDSRVPKSKFDKEVSEISRKREDFRILLEKIIKQKEEKLKQRKPFIN